MDIGDIKGGVWCHGASHGVFSYILSVNHKCFYIVSQ